MLDYIIILITLGIGIWGWLKKESTSQLYVWMAIIIIVALSVLQVRSVKEGKHEISQLQPRALSSSKISKLTPAAPEFCKVTKSILVTAANGNHEAQSYAMEFVKLFKTSGCESDLSLPIPGLRPDVTGIHIGVRNRRNIPEGASSLSRILSNAGIQCNISQMSESFFPQASFILIVGAKP